MKIISPKNDFQADVYVQENFEKKNFSASSGI